MNSSKTLLARGPLLISRAPSTRASRLPTEGVPSKSAPDKVPAANRRNPKTHQAVLAAAEELLKEIGYTSITIDRIAERSGVAKASIYRWWPNKAAVFMELYLAIVRQARMPVDTGTLEGDLREHARAAFRIFRTTVAGLALAGFVADAQSNPKTHKLLQEGIATDVRKINMALLERARERGELNPWVSVAVAADVMSGALYYQLLIRRGQFSNAEADQITDIILRGIRAGSA
ncbi:TetR/AcrR family transcriptional regulator [Variovorax sp. dw_954]|uniref:TetR/AcrR family transcriptional regulator n=1 Tax=Variovorax sp. dw_954 TaxID=2720078 RepID=UPI001BD3490A|nr:TetR/AcrR family transcriptional regulator [Variovorax sp. dw_954]